MLSGCSVFCKTPAYIYYVYMFWLCSNLLFVWNGMKLLLCIINEWVWTEILLLNLVGMAHACTDIHKQNRTRKKTTTSSILHLSNEKGFIVYPSSEVSYKSLKSVLITPRIRYQQLHYTHIQRQQKKTRFIPESITLKSLIVFIHWFKPLSNL